MKKIISLLMLISCLCLYSCRGEYDKTVGVVSDFIKEYGISCTIYSSLAPEGEDGYISPELCKQLFANTDVLPPDYSLVLHSKLDSVFELGVFLSNDAADRLAILDECAGRVRLLESLTDGEGRVLIKNNLVIYIFLKDIENALSILERVL